MPTDQVFSDVSVLAMALRKLRAHRSSRVISGRKERVPRAKLTKAERGEVLRKTGSRCHICGGCIDTNDDWQADHILAHAAGGKHEVDNYLAAHAICNNYRWNYGAEEFQLILKLVCGCEPTKTKRRSVRPLANNFANTSVSALCAADFLAPRFEL